MTLDDAYSTGWNAGYNGEPCIPPECSDEDAVELWYNGYDDGCEQLDRDETDAMLEHLYH